MKKTHPKRRMAIIMDDHEIFATTFAMLLQQTNLFEQVHTFKSEVNVTEFLIREQPKDACIFMDYFVPGSNAMQLIFNAKRFAPGVDIIVLSSLSIPALIKKIMSYNINGFIGKADSVSDILACLDAIQNKEVYLSKSVKTILSKDVSTHNIFNDFTAREMDVLIQSSWGKSIDEVAKALSLSKSTVVTHRRNLMAKAGLHSFTQLVALSIRAGIVPEK